MDLVTAVKQALDFIQQAQPGLEAAAKATTSLTTIGAAVVQLIQKGGQLYTYLIGRTDEAADAPMVQVLPRPDVAIVVDINRRALLDVAAYLQAQKIDANIVVVTNDPSYSANVRFLAPDDPAAWADLVREFNGAVGAIKHYIGHARVHIFLTTPLPLAFGLGSVWGTVDECTVYHWERGTYYPTMQVSRELRQAPTRE
ncbi:MAG: SAVED domain-containing protein [Caldilineaceae bacterium]